MSLNSEIWNEASEGTWLDPSTTPRYDNPELYDCPENHGGIICVMEGEYAVTSLRDAYCKMGVSFVKPPHYPLLVFSQKGKFGALGLPDTFYGLLLMSDIILDETQKWADKRALLVAYDRRLVDHFKPEVNLIAPSLHEHVKASGREESLNFRDSSIRKVKPLDLLRIIFGTEAKLVGCRFPDPLGFIVDLQKIIPRLSSINSESDLLSHLEEPKSSFLHVSSEENIQQRLKLHSRMRRGEELRKPICIY